MYSFVAWLSHLTSDHAPLSRRSTGSLKPSNLKNEKIEEKKMLSRGGGEGDFSNSFRSQNEWELLPES